MRDVRDRYESLREARARVRLAFRAGRSHELDFERADEEHLDVTGGEALRELQAEGSTSQLADARERNARMIAALQAAMLARGTRELAARARARPDAVELREELAARESEWLASLGFARARDFAEAQRSGVDYGFWSAQAQALLEKTASPFRDAQRAVRPLAWDELLGASRLRPALDFALEGLGAPLSRAPGLCIDELAPASARELAFAVAPNVPGEVWLVYAPRAGLPALDAFFAAAGEALHAAFTSKALPLEHRVLGDPASALVWRFFLPELLAERSFADSGLVSGRVEELAAVLRARRLESIRRAAARVAVELALAELAPGTDPHGLESLYAERLEAAVGGRPDEAQFLLECSARLGSVDVLRAQSAAFELARHLRERFGTRWWTSRRAGALLLELWNTGTRYPPEALARELGLDAPAADVLARALV